MAWCSNSTAPARRGRQDQAGEYAIPSEASMGAIGRILVEGKSIQHKLTAAEGLTSDMIWKLVQGDSVLVGDAGPAPQEGSLLPETYLFTRGETAPICWPRWPRRRRSSSAKNGPAAPRPAAAFPARSRDPGLDRGKGNLAAGRARHIAASSSTASRWA